MWFFLIFLRKPEHPSKIEVKGDIVTRKVTQAKHRANPPFLRQDFPAHDGGEAMGVVREAVYCREKGKHLYVLAEMKS